MDKALRVILHYFTRISARPLKEGRLITTVAKVTKPKLLPLPMTGEPISGTITTQSAIFPDQSHYDSYVFKGKKGQKITINMSSEELDPNLVLVYFDPERDKMELIARNDDVSPDNSTAKISLTLPTEGVYLVFANAFEPGETGNYYIQTFEQ